MPLNESFADRIPAVVSDAAYGPSWASSMELATKKRIYDKFESLSLGLAIGNPVTGGGADRVLYEDASQNLAASAKFKFDGSDLILVNPTAATSGTPAQSPPVLILRGEGWVGGATRTITTRIKAPLASDGLVDKFAVEEEIPAFATGDIFSVGRNGTSTRVKFTQPSNPGTWGGLMDITLDGIFGFKDLSGTLSGLQPGYFSWTGQSNLGYQSIRATETYGTIIQGAFGAAIGIKNPESGFGGPGRFYVEPDSSFGFNTAPSAAVHVIKTTEQLRVGYDASNYYKTTVGSTGVVTLDAVGSAAKFVFSDGVEAPGLTATAVLRVEEVVGQLSYIRSEDIDLGPPADSFITIRKSATNQWHAHPNDLMFDTTGRAQMGDPQGFANKTYVEAWDAATPDPRIRLNCIASIFIGDTEQAVNGTEFIVDDANQRFSFSTNNSITAAAIAFPSVGGGVKIGETTSDLFAFWGAAPIVQPTTGVAAASFTANSGTNVNDASTFDGYTLKQVVKALRDLGLLA